MSSISSLKRKYSSISTWGLVLILASLASCGPDENSGLRERSVRFLPCPPATVRVLVDSSGDSLYVRCREDKEVGKERFAAVHEIYRRGGCTTYAEETWYAPDTQGNILRCIPAFETIVRFNRDTLKRSGIPADGVSIWYKTSARVGESWTAYMTPAVFQTLEDPLYHKTINQYRITLKSRSDTVWVGGKAVTGCLRFLVDDLYSDDTEYEDYLAEGVGLVRRRWIEARKDTLGFVLTEIPH